MVDFSTLEKSNIFDLRRVLYLSRKQAWISAKNAGKKVGDSLFTLHFTDLIRIISNQSGPYTHFKKIQSPLNQDNDWELKLKLSKSSLSMDVLEQQICPVENTTDLDLNGVEYEFLLRFTLHKDKIILKMKVENFDSHVLRGHGLDIHLLTEKKVAATKDCIKNESWLYAASGDVMELSCNLTPSINHWQSSLTELGDARSATENFLREKYRGQNIIQGMFKANPKRDLPFSDNHADYQKTVSVLLDRGNFDLNQPISNDGITLLDFCKQHRRQPQMKFFHSINKVQSEIYDALSKRFDLEGLTRQYSAVASSLDGA